MSAYNQGYQAGKNFIQMKEFALCPEGLDPLEWQEGFRDAVQVYTELEN